MSEKTKTLVEKEKKDDLEYYLKREIIETKSSIDGYNFHMKISRREVKELTAKLKTVKDKQPIKTQITMLKNQLKTQSLGLIQYKIELLEYQARLRKL